MGAYRGEIGGAQVVANAQHAGVVGVFEVGASHALEVGVVGVWRHHGGDRRNSPHVPFTSFMRAKERGRLTFERTGWRSSPGARPPQRLFVS